MADVKLQAVITAKDEATSKVNNFQTSLGKLSAAVGIGTIAANAFQKGVSFLSDALTDSVKAAMAEQTAMTKVDAIIKTLSGDFDKNKEAILSNAKAALQLGFDDETAAESMAKLQQVTKDSKLAQDYLNVSMDLARYKNIDLESATQAMTMAMQGSGKVLKQLGIDVPDNATKTQILGMVMEKVKGQAEAFGNTAAGAQQKLAVQLENVREQFGNALLKGLTPFIQKLSDWIGKPETQVFLTNLADKLGKVMTALLQLTENAMPGVMQFINDLCGGWDEFTTILSEVIIAIDKVKRALPSITKESPLEYIGRTIKGKQMGGSVSGGRPYIVGERGPELFVPGQSGAIVPNNKMGGGGITVNFNNPSVRSDNDLSQLIATVKRSLNRDLVLEQLRV